MMIIFLVLIIVGVYFFVSGAGRRNGNGRSAFINTFTSNSDSSALDIIKERYAEGEINLSEYEEMRKAILEERREK